MSNEWQRFKQELLANPETRAAYDRRKPAYDLASLVIALRKRLDLSQRELAKIAGMSQPEIARIEKGNVSPTWETVSRIFDAVGAELEVKVQVPGGRRVLVTRAGKRIQAA